MKSTTKKTETGTTQMKNQNQICKSLFDAIQAHPPRTGERRLAIRRYQKANAQRTELKRAVRLANQS